MGAMRRAHALALAVERGENPTEEIGEMRRRLEKLERLERQRQRVDVLAGASMRAVRSAQELGGMHLSGSNVSINLTSAANASSSAHLAVPGASNLVSDAAVVAVSALGRGGERNKETIVVEMHEMKKDF